MRAVLATFRTSAADAWANRRSFWVQVSIMVANDAAWVVFWILFFQKVGSMRGWDVHKVLVLFSVLTTASGLSLGLLANARRIGPIVADGVLDAVLVLPVPPLPYLLARRMDTALLGDLFFGPILFLFSGQASPERAALFVAGSLCGAAVLVGFLVAAGSLTFFVGGRGAQADLGFQSILLLASYPLDVFGGATKLLLFTAVPAAFVTGLPTRLVDSFDAATAAALLSAAVVAVGLGSLVFRAGLRRYTSGALFVRA
jgi:ABC-2 type transport system permease protein